MCGVTHNRIIQKVDSEGHGEWLQMLLDPDLSGIKFLFGDVVVVAHQEASSYSPIVDMGNSDLVSVDHFSSGHPGELGVQLEKDRVKNETRFQNIFYPILLPFFESTISARPVRQR